jgi:hypothetical protein
MLLFLASVVEQLDLSLEHIGNGDVHNARFSLMLTDNALELVLHQIVKDKRAEAGGWRYREDRYPYETQLRKAYLGSFSDKLAFARFEAGLDEQTARTFNILHEYRNELYHAGLAHHEILPTLARLYIHTSCMYLANYEPRGLGWSSAQKMPERAKKYFGGDRHFPGKRGDFSAACQAIAANSGFDEADVVGILADDFERIVEYTDTCIGIVAQGVYEGQKTTRDDAVLGTQAWELAFDDRGNAFAAERAFTGNRLQLVDFLVENYPFPFSGDPIPSWQAQTKKLRNKADPQLALDHYHSFVKQTGPLRSALEQSAAAAEAEIDAAIDRMRGK